MPTATDYLKPRSGRYVATDAAHAELLYVRNKIALTAQEQAQQRPNREPGPAVLCRLPHPAAIDAQGNPSSDGAAV